MPKPAKAEPKKNGRPKKQLDLEQIERLATIQCTDEEIALVMKMSAKTVARHKKDPKFAAALDHGRAMGRASVRRNQYQRAAAGSDVMLIWLGKNLLNQRDTQGIQNIDRFGNPTDAPMRVIVELVGDPAPPRDEQHERGTGSRLSDALRQSIDLVG